jgi:hypothetical protein
VHIVHVDPVLLYPGIHVHDEALVAPEPENLVPAGHAKHAELCLCPVDELYVFDGHNVFVDALGQYEPVGHCIPKALALPAGQYTPAFVEHAEHAELIWLPVYGLYVPIGQSVHTVRPVKLLYVPVGHAVAAVLIPAGQ